MIAEVYLMGDYCILLLRPADCNIPLGVRLRLPKLMYTTVMDEDDYFLARTCGLCSMLSCGVLNVFCLLQTRFREHRLCCNCLRSILRYDVLHVLCLLRTRFREHRLCYNLCPFGLTRKITPHRHLCELTPNR